MHESLTCLTISLFAPVSSPSLLAPRNAYPRHHAHLPCLLVRQDVAADSLVPESMLSEELTQDSLALDSMEIMLGELALNSIVQDSFTPDSLAPDSMDTTQQRRSCSCRGRPLLEIVNGGGRSFLPPWWPMPVPRHAPNETGGGWSQWPKRNIELMERAEMSR